MAVGGGGLERLRLMCLLTGSSVMCAGGVHDCLYAAIGEFCDRYCLQLRGGGSAAEVDWMDTACT